MATNASNSPFQPYSSAYNRPWRSIAQRVVFADRLADERRHFILAERDDHLLGFAELARQPALATPDGPDGLELVRLYVQPAFHRRGIGRALLQEAETQGRALQAGALWLTVWSGNQRGLGFYRSRGYKDAGTTRYVAEGTAYENRILVKQLAQPAAGRGD